MSESVSTAPATKSKNVKITVAASIVTVLLLAAALFFSAFEFSPVRQVPKTADKAEMAAFTKFMGNIFMSYNIQKKLKSPEYTFVFSESELNAALNMAIRNYQAMKKEDKKYIFYTQANAGTMEFDVSYPKWGMYLNFRVVAVPEVKDGNIVIKVKSARLGKLPLPAGKVEGRIAEEIAEKLEEPMALAGMQMLRKVEFTSGNNLKVVVDSVAGRYLKKLLR